MSNQQYDFDQAFSTKVVALMLRDHGFAEATAGLVKPEYFEQQAFGYLAQVASQYYEQFRCTPSSVALVDKIRQAKASGQIPDALMPTVSQAIRDIYHTDLTDRSYVMERVVTFARHRAMENALLKAVDHLNRGEYDDIDKLMREARAVGSNESQEYDYFDEIENRQEKRKELLSGRIQPTGITTGCIDIDNRLYHRGFGREELSVYMGSAKAGKSFALIYSAASAMLAGNNVLYITLENSREVTSDRFDAYFSGCQIVAIKHEHERVAERLRELRKKHQALLKIEAFPTGTWTPMDAHRVIQRYKNKGIFFDEMVVDYLDIMAANRRSKDNPIEESKSIWQDMRALAQREHLALVTATQTNRSGFKATVADATHVSEDINKVRIADLVISINRDDDDRRNQDARLFFAASRNQQDGFTVKVNQDLSRAQFLKEVVSIT